MLVTLLLWNAGNYAQVVSDGAGELVRPNSGSRYLCLWGALAVERERERLLTQEESSPFPHSQAPSRTIAKLQSQLLAIRRSSLVARESCLTQQHAGKKKDGDNLAAAPSSILSSLRYPPLPLYTGTHRTQRALPHLIASQSTALHTGRVPLHTLIHREILVSSYWKRNTLCAAGRRKALYGELQWYPGEISQRYPGAGDRDIEKIRRSPTLQRGSESESAGERNSRRPVVDTHMTFVKNLYDRIFRTMILYTKNT